MATGAKNNPELAKKLLESIQTDLRTLSAETKRKHPEVKEVNILNHQNTNICCNLTHTLILNNLNSKPVQ